MKIAVLGIGGSGSAALRFLAQSGHEATGFEQFSLGHSRGSSHGQSRIIRYSYPDSFHTKLMARAYELWDDLERETGENLFVRCGGITFGPPDEPRVKNTRASLESAGLGYDFLSRDAASERFPALDIGAGNVGIFQSKSGFLRSSDCVLAQANAAQKLGATLHENTPGLALEETASGIHVSTREKTETFDAAICTAGPWMGKLLPHLKLPLETALRQVVYLGIARNEADFSPERLPVWIEKPAEYYGFPSDGVVAGVKFASHGAGYAFDPDESQRPLMPDALAAAVKHVKTHFPDLGDEISFAQSCLYTVTPDELFILDYAPNSERIVVCSGCSGHGFKWTILLGKIAATLAQGERFDADLTPWRITRMGR